MGLSISARESRSATGIFGVHLFNMIILTSVVFGCLVTLATVFPFPFIHAADPFTTPPGARPAWYLLAWHGFLESFPSLVPRWLRGILLEGVLAFCILLPFIDRSPTRAASERRRAIVLGALVLALWIIFSWMGYRMEAGR